MLIVKKFYMRL